MDDKFRVLVWAIPATAIVLLLVRYFVREVKTDKAISLAQFIAGHTWVVARAPQVFAEGKVGEWVTLVVTGDVDGEQVLTFLYFPHSHPDYKKIRDLKFVSPVQFGYRQPPHNSVSSTDTTAYLTLKDAVQLPATT